MRVRSTITRVVLALLAAGLFSCLPVKRQRVEHTAGYRKTLQGLDETLRCTGDDAPFEVSRGAVSVGWAKRPVPFETGWPLAGYGIRAGAPSTGTADEVFLRALALQAGDGDPIVVLSGGLLLVIEGLAERVTERINETRALPRDRLLFGATHTHCGPGAYGEGLVAEIALGAYREETAEKLVAALSQTALDALEALRPGKIGSATFYAPQHVVNRTEKDGPIDPTGAVLAAERDDGSRMCLIQYSAHATILGPDVMQLHGDYPGALERRVEAAGYDSVQFMAATPGSAGPGLEDGDFDDVERYAEGLAIPVERACARALRLAEAESRLGATRVKLNLPDYQILLGEDVRLPSVFGEALVGPPEAHLHAVVLGRTLMLGLPGELSMELGRDMKVAGRRLGLRVMPSVFNGDYHGYVVPDRLHGSETYEGRLMAWHGPGFGTYLKRVTTRLMRRAGPCLYD